MKICVLGYSGAGKSTLSKLLAKFYNLPLLHFDQIKFSENWQNRNKEEILFDLREFMKLNQWVIDGNYFSFDFELRIKQADFIIFLNYSRFLCLRQARKRYKEYKGKVRDSVAKGCYEKFDLKFLLWILFQERTAKRKKHYKQMITLYPGKVLVFKNPKKLKEYLMKIL